MILKDGIWDKLWIYGRMKEWYFLALSELWDSGKRATGIWLEEEGWRGVCGVRPGGAFCPFCHVRSHDVRLTAAAQPWCSGWWVRPTWWAFRLQCGDSQHLNHSQHFGAFLTWVGGHCIGEEWQRIMKSGHSFNMWTKFVPRHRHKVMLLAQQLLGSDVKAPVSSSEFMDYPRFYLFNDKRHKRYKNASTSAQNCLSCVTSLCSRAMPRSLVHGPGQTQPNDRPALPLPWLCSAFAYIAIHCLHCLHCLHCHTLPHCHAFAQPTVQAPGRRWLNRSPPSRVNCERFHLHQKSVKIFTPCPINYPSPPKLVGESTLLKDTMEITLLNYYIILFGP